MLEIKKYDASKKQVWNQFVTNAKNGHFLFYRDYMEYHKERFEDASLMIYEEQNVLAIIAATQCKKEFVTHGGLTFGGLLLSKNIKTIEILEIFTLIISYLRENEFTSFIYKAIPHIYHILPAEEDLYSLFKNNAQLIARNVSATIVIDKRLPYSKGRKWSVKKSYNNELAVIQSVDFDAFFKLEEQLLKEKYNTSPVHTAQEMRQLGLAFPENIKLFICESNGTIVAGVLLYISTQVTHCQYVGSNELGRKLGAVDLIIDTLLSSCTTAYFDFGTSNLEDGHYLETSLLQNKESYGARAICYDKYKITL